MHWMSLYLGKILEIQNTRVADGTLDAHEQRDVDAIFAAATKVHSSQENVKRASIGTLNTAVPKKYKRTNGIGTSTYK